MKEEEELPIFSGTVIISGVCGRAIFGLFVPRSSLTLVLPVSKTLSYSQSLALITDGDTLTASWPQLHVMDSRLA